MAQIQIITPNDKTPPALNPFTTTTIFLAGPTNENWRDPFIALFKKEASEQAATTTTTTDNTTVSSFPIITLIDPTQPKWDSTWVQDYDAPADTRFRTQVDWELDRQTSADLVVFYFVAGQAAPVSLLELGLALGGSDSSGSSGQSNNNKKKKKKRRVLVGCEKGYRQRGNVQAVCARHDVSFQENLEGLVEAVVAACRS